MSKFKVGNKVILKDLKPYQLSGSRWSSNPVDLISRILNKEFVVDRSLPAKSKFVFIRNREEQVELFVCPNQIELVQEQQVFEKRENTVAKVTVGCIEVDTEKEVCYPYGNSTTEFSFEEARELRVALNKMHEIGLL